MARKKETAPQPTSVPCPFTVIIDTQEKIPYEFSNIPSNADTNYLPFDIAAERRFLGHLGDYSADFPELGPWEQPKIVIERKSKIDLFGTVADRENWEWRLNLMNEQCQFSVVVVESEWSDIFDNPPEHTKYSPTSLHRSVQSWQQRFRNVHWSFYECREAAEQATFWYLYRFYENIRNHKLDLDIKKSNYNCFIEGMSARRKNRKSDECPYKKEHAFGDNHDYWVRGWLEMNYMISGRPRELAELPPVNDDVLAAGELQ